MAMLPALLSAGENALRKTGTSTLANLIGNEVIGATGKALAANTAKNLGTQIAVNAINKASTPIAVNALGKATQYRGVSANSMQDLLGIVDSSKNSIPTTYTGGQTYGSGAYFFNNPEDAKNWAVAHQPGEYKAVLAIDRPLGSYIDYGTYRKNRSDFISRLDAPGSQINQIADAAFNKYMDKNGVTGYVGNNYEGRNPVYVVKNPEAMKNLRVSSVYTPDTKDWAAVEGDLQNFVTQNNLETYLGSPENQANSDMMTLYRGLSQKYDPNYPVARLDTSGYESWTDNPELAKQYGDYVYSIDVPKADIKSSYLDENPSSPTYGDRNPIYSIDKKAGLNGVSGNEYLLEVGSDYQKGLKYNEYQPGIVKKYLGEPKGSLPTDFSKSKIKDKKGNLLKLYHGTDADFSEFGDVKTEPGYWFTEDKDYALSHGKNLKTVNLNMVKPLDVTTLNGNNKMWEYAKDCFGTENVSEDDIMSNRFRDYLIDKGYDGIIFDHSGKNTYIVFSPEQIKNVDNINSTGNKIELNPQQQEFFKDSVIRDKDGKLKKMYHGSPNSKIKEFNPGSYFTENKEYADGYQNPEASSLMPGARKIKNTPKTYEVYLNIKKPFTLSDAKAKDIYFNEYIKGGNSAYYDPYGTTKKMIDELDEVDWTEGINLMEWLQENHPEYDGMYLDEGGAGGYSPDNEYVDRGKSVVNFRGDQVKILNA